MYVQGAWLGVDCLCFCLQNVCVRVCMIFV